MSEKLKVLIADDERLQCVVIQDAVDFAELDLELLGFAFDGVSLLNFIEDRRPDIVITDISMPGLNGLELIREVRQKNIECKFIIISGYSQFDYAKTAIKYKVEDYLLKPINATELNEVLHKLKNNVLIEQENREINLELLKKNTENKESLRKLFFSRIINNYKLQDNLGEVNNQYDISFEEDEFQCFVAKLDSINENLSIKQELDSFTSKILRIFYKSLEPICHDTLYYYENNIIYFIINYKIENSQKIYNSLKESFSYAKNMTQLFKGLKITLGVGSTYSEGSYITSIKKSLNEALLSIYHRLKSGTEKAYYFSKIAKDIEILNISEHSGSLDKIRKSFEAFNKSDFLQNINQIFEKHLNNPENLILISFEIEKLFFEINSIMKNGLTNEKYYQQRLHQGILNSISADKLKKYISENILGMIDKQQSLINEIDTRPVRETITYINEHYHQNINLEKVAEEINFNPVYISNIFKKETGENFTDYLNKHRIEASKEIIRSTKESISNISKKVGFNDSKYFSKLFKKYVGLKPTEYRDIYGS